MSDRRDDEERYSKEAFRSSKTPSDDAASDSSSYKRGLVQNVKDWVDDVTSGWVDRHGYGHPVSEFSRFFKFLSKLVIYLFLFAFLAGIAIKFVDIVFKAITGI